MKSEYVVLLMLLGGGVFITIIFLFDIPVVSNAAPILAFAFVVVLLIVAFYYLGPYLFQKTSTSSGLIDSFDALRYLQDRWYEARKEKLAPLDAKANFGWYEDKLFYAFRLTKTTGEEGNVVVALVQAQPRDIVFEENPTQEEIANPFLILNTEYKPAPIKNAKKWKNMPMWQSLTRSRKMSSTSTSLVMWIPLRKKNPLILMP